MEEVSYRTPGTPFTAFHTPEPHRPGFCSPSKSPSRLSSSDQSSYLRKHCIQWERNKVSNSTYLEGVEKVHHGQHGQDGQRYWAIGERAAGERIFISN